MIEGLRLISGTNRSFLHLYIFYITNNLMNAMRYSACLNLNLMILRIALQDTT